MIDLVEIYYSLHGTYDFKNDDNKNKTRKTLEYLKEAGVSENDIIKIIEDAPKKDFLTHEDIPQYMWEDSLLERDTFYFHNELQILSPAPSMDMKTLKIKSSPFYIEMRIKFSAEDLLNYYYKKANTEPSFKDKKKDIGAITYLLSQYKKIKFVESVDFLLMLIDYATKETDCSTSNLLQIDSRFKEQVFELAKKHITEARAIKADSIIYR